MDVSLELNGHSLRVPYPAVVGILNFTPDSFSDGGRYQSVDAALARARQMIDEGASWIDLGAESTRPGSQSISTEEELARLLPVLDVLESLNCILSVDTNKIEVQRAMLERGVPVINDIFGGSDELFELAAEYRAGLILMHTSARPEVMQQNTSYSNVVDEVYAYLKARVECARAKGVPAVWCDPGIGFGKTLEQNLALMRATPRFAQLGNGVLIGASRKSWMGKLCGAEVHERLGGSVAAALECAARGAALIRVHDVRETVQALAVQSAFAATSQPTVAYIALGSNLGDARDVFQRVVEALEKHGKVLRRAQLYRSKPWGYADQPDFTNSALSFMTSLDPFALIAVLQSIEQALGKVMVCPNGPRVIDLDLLFYGNRVIHTDTLTVPHPRAHERDFVLLPLCDLAPDWVHPVFGEPLETLLGWVSDSYFTGSVESWDSRP